VIRIEAGGPCWTIVIDRPDKANALTADMLNDLIAAIDRAHHDGARAVVLTGAGRVFSAGADLEAARAGLATSPLWERLSATIARLPCLTVAALNGTVAGGAFGMALACDLRITVPGARFFYPVMRLGFLMAGIKATADEAMAWGLVDRIVPDDQLLQEARALADDTCAAPPAHSAAIKAMIPQG
jgi:enoyl-CoA hydratase/carnithine racemase